MSVRMSLAVRVVTEGSLGLTRARGSGIIEACWRSDMKLEEQLMTAIRLATTWHDGQYDKAGMP